MDVESDILSIAIGCEVYHSRAYEYGERAWRASGINIDVIYWDGGNGWCDIMAVIPKKGAVEKEIMRFYQRLSHSIEKSYDEDGYRIG